MKYGAERLHAAWVAADAGFEELREAMATGSGYEGTGATGATGAHLQQAWTIAARLLVAVLDVLAPRADTGDIADSREAGQDDPAGLTAPGPGAGPLVAALRERGLCTLDEGHVLIDLHATAARAAGGSERGLGASELAQQQVLRARDVLERIVRTAQPSAAPDATALPHSSPERVSSQPPPPSAVAEPTAAGVSGRRSSLFVVALVVCCLLGAGITAVLFTGVGRSDPVSEGIAAYEAGQRTAARVAFEQARVADSTAAVPLIYLGRLAREEGDFSEARRLLDQAVQLEPQNALTHRELAGALLADGEPELARRFYVRALTINAEDRVAQGFLACALHQLGRDDEAVRWNERAGAGDWSACLNAPPPSPTPSP